MASTINSKTTTKTKQVAGKKIKNTTTETTVVSTSDSIALDTHKKKVEALLATLVRNRENIADLEKEKKETSEALYALMGWEQVKVGEKTRWVGVAKKGTIKGATRITISERTRKEIDREKLELSFPEVFASVSFDNIYTVILTK